MKVELLIEEGCALCEQAREVLESLREELGLEITVTDARSNSFLLARHRYDLPVIRLDGHVLSQRTADRAEIERRLRHAQLIAENRSQALASATSGRRVVKVSMTEVAGATRPLPPPSPASAPAGNRRVVKVSMAEVAGAATAASPALADRREKAEKKRAREKLPALDLPHPEGRFLLVDGFPGAAARRMVEQIPGVEEVRVGGMAGVIALRGRNDAVAAAQQQFPKPAKPSPPGRALALGLGAAVAGLAGPWLVPSLAWVLAAAAALLPLALREARQLVRDRPLAGAYPLVASAGGLLAAARGELGPWWAAAPAAIHLFTLAPVLWVRRRARAILDVPEEGEIRSERVTLEEGEAVPADARLLAPCVVDEGPLGGEEDVERLAGEEVLAGSIVRQRVEIEILPGPGRLALARRRLGLALAGGKGEERQGRLAALVPAAGLVAAGFAWALRGTPAGAAVLVGFPALAASLVASLGRAVALLRAHADGVALASASALDRAGRVRTVIFGKRAILERGLPVVLGVRSRHPDPLHVLDLAAAAEARIDHPIARAIVHHAHELGRELPRARLESYQEGAGVAARVGEATVHVGSAAFLARNGVDVTALAGLAQEMAQRGSTPVLVAVDRVAAGAIEIGAFPAYGARQALGSLELAEVRPHLATSDHGQRARWLAVALGLDPAQAVGDLSDESEARLIDELERPVMVVAGASHLARSSEADLVVCAEGDARALSFPAHLVRADPRAVATMVRTGRAWRRARRAGLSVAVLAALGAIGLGLAGRLGLSGAVALSAAGSLLSTGAALLPWLRLR